MLFKAFKIASLVLSQIFLDLVCTKGLSYKPYSGKIPIYFNQAFGSCCVLVLLALLEINLHNILTCTESVTLTFFKPVILACLAQVAVITTDMEVAGRETAWPQPAPEPQAQPGKVFLGTCPFSWNSRMAFKGAEVSLTLCRDTSFPRNI